MTEIERMLRNGKSVEDLIAEINSTKAKLDKQEAAKAAAEKEKKAKAAKIKKAKADFINAAILYTSLVFDVSLDSKDIKTATKELENYCNIIEAEAASPRSFKTSSSDLITDLYDTFF